MNEMLQLFFSVICGQNPDHTWAPGGWLLPCCQRCTGLYVGAFCAALLHLALRPRLNARFLEVHGVFLLLMVPFGFHWVPQGPALRAITGLLFGHGLVTFLWLLPAFEARVRRLFPVRITEPQAWAGYAGGVIVSLLGLPFAGVWGGRLSEMLLPWLAFAGALLLAALVLANAAFAISR